MRELLVLPLLCTLMLGACTKADDGDDGPVTPKAYTLSVFDPTGVDPTLPDGALPFPNDLLFAGFNDPTLNIPNSAATSFVTAANQTDGFSTSASIFFDFSSSLDLASVSGALLFINARTGEPLVEGTDYRLQASPVVSNSRVLIELLKPLAGSTQYLLAVTDRATSTDGLPVAASDVFKIVRSGTPVSEQTAPLLVGLSDAQKAQLEQVRAAGIRPVVSALVGAAGVTEEQLVIAWSFTTQSVGKTLQRLEANATAGAIFAAPSGQTTGQALEGAGAIPAGAGSVAPFNNSDLWVGFVDVPYFLEDHGGSPQSTAPLTTFFSADPTLPDTNARFLGQVPCGAFASGAPLPDGQTARASASTTTCFPVPVVRSTQRIPMLVTVPNANSGKTRPANGWPVVIYQHGITSDRSTLLAVAPALAAAGFVAVAIDLPLHGLSPGHPLRGEAVGAQERTFDLDLANNTTRAPGPDGTADASGTHYLNLSSLLTARDNLRQSVADHFTLVESLANLDLDGNPSALAADHIDETRVSYLGISQGSIVGTTTLAFEDKIGAASLSVPGGGIAKLLDASKSFGPVVAAGLAAAGVEEGTDNFETYLRFAQHLVDPADPINHITSALAKHNVHLTKVAGDLVVPNNALANDGSGTEHQVTVSGFLSGTDPMISVGGFQTLGPITAPVATADQSLTVDAGGLDVAVTFTNGSHASLLDPGSTDESRAVTAEMQTQSANFLASGGTCLPIGRSCPSGE